jgi:hypothetical protein
MREYVLHAPFFCKMITIVVPIYTLSKYIVVVCKLPQNSTI